MFPYVFEDWAVFRDWKILGKHKIDPNIIYKIGENFYLSHESGFRNIRKEAVKHSRLSERSESMTTITVINDTLKPLLGDGGLLMAVDNDTDYENVLSDSKEIFEKLAFEYPGYKFLFLRDPANMRNGIRVEITYVDDENWKGVAEFANRMINEVTKDRKYGFKFIPYVTTF